MPGTALAKPDLHVLGHSEPGKLGAFKLSGQRVRAGSRVARSKHSRSAAVEHSAPAPASAGSWNGATGLPLRVWPVASRVRCWSDGVMMVSGMPSGRQIRWRISSS